MITLIDYAFTHPYIALAIAITILKAILNRYLTPHPSDAQGWRKPLLILLDLLSLAHSKNSVGGGLKLPGATSPRK